MKAIMVYMKRVNGQLQGNAKLMESSTKKDIKLTAHNLATQLDARLMDIIFDDNPLWQDYMTNTTKSNLWA